MTTPDPQRRTQGERTAETRRKLLEATVSCLLDKGYAHTTTTLVAKRAGVSRGAQLHHFPKKAELVRAAIEHVFDQRVAEFRAAMAHLPEGEDRLARAIDLLWESYSERGTFYPCLEFMVAARTDEELRSHVEPVVQRIEKTVKQIFSDLFPDLVDSSLGDLAPLFAMALMDGVALARIARRSDEIEQRMLAGLKLLAGLLQQGGMR